MEKYKGSKMREYYKIKSQNPLTFPTLLDTFLEKYNEGEK